MAINPKTLFERSIFFLANAHALAKESIPEIRDILREHNRLYYTESAPVITDKEYDSLFALLGELETRFSDFDPHSPTARIDVMLSRQFQKARHLSPMISLDNTYDEADIADFEKRIRNILKTEADLAYMIDLKFDGL